MSTLAEQIEWCRSHAEGGSDMARDVLARLEGLADAQVSGAPTDDDLEALIKPLWLAERPSREAQSIRSRLSTGFDDPKHRQWASDVVPDYVWDLVDIAAQRGMTAAATKARREAITAVRKRTTEQIAILASVLLRNPCRDEICRALMRLNEDFRALSPTPQNTPEGTEG